MKQKNIIIKPLVTEKSMSESSQGRYIFKVSKRATKGQIKESIEETFNVDVLKVNTVKQSGKRRRVGRLRREIKRPDGKKSNYNRKARSKNRHI